MRYQLRPYQLEAVDGARERIRNGSRACIIVAPTGSGKTVIASHIVEQSVLKGKRTLFLAHRKELIDQCSGKLDDIGIWHGIIKAGNNRVHPSALVQVASVQTLGRRMERFGGGYDLIIVDECHHAVAASYSKILEANPTAKVLGLTATPYRADGKGLGDLFQSYIEVATVEGLVREGYLVPQRVFVGRKVHLGGVKLTAGDYNLQQLEGAVNQPKLVGNIVEAWKKNAAGRATVCFATTIAHSQAIMEAFKAAGVTSAHLDGETPQNEREDILARFAAGEINVLCNCGVLTEGWDCPFASCIILARPTKSRCLWRQMCGRVLRPFPGKANCIILDHGNCSDAHGYLTDPDKIGLHGKDGGTRPTPTRECRQCGARFSGRPPFCPQCGAVLDTTEGGRLDKDLNPLGDAGYEMVEARALARKQVIASKADVLYLKDLEQARLKGYAPGWAAIRFKTRTGKWPTKELKGRSRFGTKMVLGQDGRWKEMWQ